MSVPLNLDVASPAEVPGMLRAAADAYRESASELVCAWQEKAPGAIWTRLATIMERAADSADKALKANGF